MKKTAIIWLSKKYQKRSGMHALLSGEVSQEEIYPWDKMPKQVKDKLTASVHTCSLCGRALKDHGLYVPKIRTWPPQAVLCPNVVVEINFDSEEVVHRPNPPIDQILVGVVN